MTENQRPATTPKIKNNQLFFLTKKNKPQIKQKAEIIPAILDLLASTTWKSDTVEMNQKAKYLLKGFLG